MITDPKKADRASDVFSVGCLAWLLFTGQHPAATLAERERRIKDQKGLRLAPLRGDLDDAVAWATEPYPLDR